jgi:large conductance mechanosensitive channel
MPPIGLLLGGLDFSSFFYVLDHSKGTPVSLADAKAQAIPVIAYGQFINDVIAFLIIAAVIFVLVRQVNRIQAAFDHEPQTPSTRECPYCVSMISLKATRCPQCTSQLEPSRA